MKKIFISVIILTLIFSCALFEKKQVISGTVIMKSTSEPMEGVRVAINNTDVYTVTDSTGFYRISYKDLSEFQLVFTHKGYETTRVDIVEDKDKRRYEIDVALEREK